MNTALPAPLTPTPPTPLAQPRARVALVVDHPLRDLPGLALVARRLCGEGCEVLLVPANIVERELWPAAPDFVLLNYLRRVPHLERMYRALQDAGVAVGVLDTEGGVVESPEAFARDLATSRSIRRRVACYCTWGPLLADHLRRGGVFDDSQLFVTGCPRTDYYAAPWRQAVALRDAPPLAHHDRLILINTNFSLVNPEMISREQQLDLMTAKLGHPRARVVAWQNGEAEGMRGMAAIAGRLAERFPSAAVVLRPHPFERLQTYRELLPERPNLHCLREGAIEPWLLGARAVIQRSCSTSIEAAMVGAPAISPNWLPTAFERPAANATSIPCASPEELFQAVDRALTGGHTLPLAVARRSEQVIRDWYRVIDGAAHRRVAEAILASLPTTPRRRRERSCRWGAYTAGRRFPNKRWFRGARHRLIGRPPAIDGRATGGPDPPSNVASWDASLKRFDRSDVQQLLNAADHAAGAADRTAEVARGALWAPHQRTILLRPTGAL